MIIEVNTKLINITNNLNLNQLLFLSMVLGKNQKFNQDVQQIVSLISDDEISYLINQGLITSMERGNSIVYQPTDKLKDFVKPNKDYFDLFYDIYPSYVLRPDGTKGYLRTNVNKCRHLFNTYTGGSQAMAEHLIDCLDKEIKRKMNQGKIGYMKTMWRWLVDHQWEETEEEMQDTTINNVSSYGTDIL